MIFSGRSKNNVFPDEFHAFTNVLHNLSTFFPKTDERRRYAWFLNIKCYICRSLNLTNSIVLIPQNLCN